MTRQVEAWPGRAIDDSSFVDITPKAVVEIAWDLNNDMRVVFAEDLTPNEAYRCRRRLRTTPEQEEIEKAAIGAYNTLQNFRNTTSPNSTAVANQVKAQAQVLQGIIKILFQDAAKDLGVW